MAEEKEKVVGGSSREEPKKVLVGEVLPPEKPVCSLVLFSGELRKQFGIAYVDIVTAIIGKAKKGDLASIKLLVELVEKFSRAEEISEEEVDTLAQMLLREFHALEDEESGGQEEKMKPEKVA